jgi:hypothetical protein
MQITHQTLTISSISTFSKIENEPNLTQFLSLKRIRILIMLVARTARTRHHLGGGAKVRPASSFILHLSTLPPTHHD